MPSASEFNRRLRTAQRQAEQQMRRNLQKAQQEVDAHNRRVAAATRRAVAESNRRIDTHNRRVADANHRATDDHNRKVDAHNRRARTHNQRVIDDINKRLQAGGRPQVRYSPQDRTLVERVQHAIVVDAREYDVFLSYARIDGGDTAGTLHHELESLGITVWFDEVTIQAGRSQSLQMDQGLRKARAGVVVLTPAYLTGRFWSERELGALLHKSTLIPVLHNVTFADVRQYSGILPDLVGFGTAHDSIAGIAAKIAAAVTPASDQAAS